ncbi:hypothetical protein [Paludibaculum fermentans]|uniref:hypothetical protein n=1 Tax=Paludibaculum fermentans TaxID=1473598 RepID=UPI003EBE7377
MTKRGCWLDLFTGTTWKEFIAAGGTVSGFPESRWKTVQQVRVGDYLLCYLTGISRFIGVLEVVKAPYKDNTKLIWKDDVFPCRLGVKPIEVLTPDTAIPILDLKDRLSIFDPEKGPSSWTGYVRAAPAKWKDTDGEIILQAIHDAKQRPISRPFDPKKLARRPTALKSRVGTVTVPESEPQDEPGQPAAKETSAHNEIQWLLAKLGNDMGLDVWVARNDRNREINGSRFTELPRLKSELPIQFDDATNKTIELIDVLWLQKHSIVAAFEIESTTSIYSGLLRLSDLISMQPNLSIPLFIVAPDERRDKVIAEVNRPTFSKLTPPMYQMCRLVTFSTLRKEIQHVGNYVKRLRADILDDWAESCEVEEL